MRRMHDSKVFDELVEQSAKSELLNEEVFESGIWEVASGITDGSKAMLAFESGYHYKLYFNGAGSVSSMLRIETELGFDEDYIAFIPETFTLFFTLGNLDGATNIRYSIYKGSGGVFTNLLRFTGTTTAPIKIKYLITRHKINY